MLRRMSGRASSAACACSDARRWRYEDELLMGRNRKKSSPGTLDQALMAETFGALLRLLRDLQSIYGDDYEAVAIALLVHKVTFSDSSSDTLHSRSSGNVTREGRASVSRLKIAEQLRIPRETVRRKVNELIALGVIEEVGHAQLVTAGRHRTVVQEFAVSMTRLIPAT